MKNTLKRLAVLVVGGVSLGFVINAIRPDGVSFEQRQVVASCEVETSPILEISAADAAALCAQSDTVIVDVRPEKEFVGGHIPGAVHITCRQNRLEGDMANILASAERVLVYANDTDGARQVAQSLGQRNYPVRILVGGYPEWEAAGQACASGPCEECAKDLHAGH